MKQSFNKKINRSYRLSLQLVCALLILVTTPIIGSSENSNISTSKNLFLQRAFSANTSRELLMQGHVTTTDFDGFYSFFSFTGAYQHSWDENNIYGLGAFPFWSGTNSMTIGTNSGTSNLDGYQFGLGTVATPGSITLNPIVYQGGSDFLLYFGASINDPGMFIKLKAPLGVIAINPQLTEVPAQLTLTTNGQYPAGSIQQTSTNYADFATTMSQAFRGTLNNGQSKIGDFLPMQYGMIDGTQNSGAQFGDIEMALGYNFICNEDYLFGIAFRASAPSANKPTEEFLLEPIFGRGGSWGVGGYINASAKLWHNHTNQSLNINLMGTILHLVRTTDTMRSYDLTANGPGSKYLLVADYNGGTYQGVIQNLINISTLQSSSSLSAEGDLSISLSYISNRWSADLGYNFWGRSGETLTITGQFPENRYAVLGRQSVGQIGDPTAATNLCQPTATIKSSNPQLNAQSNLYPEVVDAQLPANRISGNWALNSDAAQQSSTSTSKLFAKTGYSWLDSHFSPHVGLAGEFEISTASNNALPQWSVAFIAGMYF